MSADTGGEFPEPEIDADTREPCVPMERPVTETPLSHVCAANICADIRWVTEPLGGGLTGHHGSSGLTRCSAVVSCSCSWCSGWPQPPRGDDGGKEPSSMSHPRTIPDSALPSRTTPRVRSRFVIRPQLLTRC
jgi:hypothetical protein